MAISDKVKALLKLKGKNNQGLADYLGISSQALSNKFYRDSYSGEDLIKIANFLECELVFITGETKISLMEPPKPKAAKQPVRKTKPRKEDRS
jgi:transcriptional regulator with XRE-family HTH domain